MAINEFRGKYACFSNFHDAKIIVNGVVWPTVEHAFQANKTFDKGWQGKIMSATSPANAKRLAKELKTAGFQRADWEEVKLPIMFSLVILKFMMFDEYRKILLNTGKEEIVEGNWWHDNFWGDCNCEKCKNITGQNNLGKLLMVVRQYLCMFSIF